MSNVILSAHSNSGFEGIQIFSSDVSELQMHDLKIIFPMKFLCVRAVQDISSSQYAI